MSKPTCYIIAGPNGAGKTTFAREFLPNVVECMEFLNPDLIAQGLSPFDPVRHALQAGRIMIDRIKDLTNGHADFAMETTLSGHSYTRLFRHMKQQGYLLCLFFVWLPSPDLALLRIEDRVRHGGHNVPEGDVRRRFSRSNHNLHTIYLPLMDSVYVYDNSGEQPEPIWLMEHGTANALDTDKSAQFLKEGTA